MKITNFNPDGIPVALGGWSTGITSLNSNIATTDGGLSAINFVQRITANGSNILLNPAINFAAGSNITLAAASNTITITGAAGGGSGTTFGTPALVLGTAAGAGAIDEAIRRDSTIVAFDATVPVTQAFSDAAATGSAAVAARRDHKHGMPASGGGGGLSQSYLGYNTIGGTWTTVTNKRIYCKKITLSGTATILSVDAYLRPSTDNIFGINGMVMADNSNAPGVLVAGNGTNQAEGFYLSNSATMPGAGRWFSIAIGATLPAGDYWLAFQISPGIIDIANDGSGSDQHFTPGTFILSTGAYPTAWAITTTALQYSIRANILA